MEKYCIRDFSRFPLEEDFKGSIEFVGDIGWWSTRCDDGGGQAGEGLIRDFIMERGMKGEKERIEALNWSEP